MVGVETRKHVDTCSRDLNLANMYRTLDMVHQNRYLWNRKEEMAAFRRWSCNVLQLEK
jgi:hypothetical protein